MLGQCVKQCLTQMGNIFCFSPLSHLHEAEVC